MQMNLPVSIVIPNFNGESLLRKNLPSVVRAANEYAGDCQIIVVDDGSADDSVNILKNEFPEIFMIQHEKNQGFAEAVHTGVRAANSELVLLLNTDVEVHSNLIEPLVKYFEEPDTFSVNPLIYDEKGDAKRHSWNLRELKGGHLKIAKWSMPEALERRNAGEKLPTAYAHGGSYMMRKSMFEKLNGFHPIFKPFYGEDYDLGLRAWRYGWPSYFEPNVSIVHQSKGAIRSNVKFNYVRCIRRRNRYLIEWIHLPVWDLLIKVLPFTILQLIGELLTFDRVNLKGFFLAVMKLNQAMSFRKELIKNSQYNMTEILDKINAK